VLTWLPMADDLYLHGAVVSTAQGLRSDLGVHIRGGTIAALGTDAPRGATAVDLGGGLLLPGFVDLQVNGGGGVLFNSEPTFEGIERIVAAHRRQGTTALLPTLITDHWAVVERALDAVDEAIAAGMAGVLGLHLEGPFLNPKRKGVHDATRMTAPSDAQIARLAAPRRGALMVTLAPECVPPGTVRRLSDAGVIVCAGHSDATYEQVRSALDEGLAGFTHLFNAMSPLASREPGMVGAALDDRRSWCALIVDGHHVHPATLRVAIAAKGSDRCLLVSDAMSDAESAGSGLELQGRRILRDGTRLADEAGTLAGSLLDLASAVRHGVQWLGLALPEAVRMASLNPARMLGLGDRLGAIAPGLRADIVHTDDKLRVRRTWVGGKG